MVKSRLSLFPPSSIEEIVQQIVLLEPSAFEILQADVVGRAGFETDRRRCETLSHQIGLPPEVIALVFNALSFLYARIKATAPENSQILISNLIGSFPDDSWSQNDKEIGTERLQLLLLDKKIEHFRKIHRLKQGFIKNATSFSSFVDIRPDFQNESAEIHGFVPIIQFRITTDSENYPEKEFVFQLDDNGLRALKEAIESLEKKIETLNYSKSLIAPLYSSKK